MKKTTFLALAAVMVVSCASGPSQRSLQSSHSAAAESSRPFAKPITDAPFEYSLPFLQGPHESSSDIALRLPEEALSNPALTIVSIQPTEPSSAQNFPFKMPQFPDVSKPQVSATKPRVRSAGPNTESLVSSLPKKAAAALPRGSSASAAQQTGPAQEAPIASQQQAAAAQDANPALGGAAETASSSGSRSQATAPYGRLREIYAREGDDVQIGLDGVGFLFLGFPDRSSNGDGMSFKGKDTRDEKTWFSFKALKLGTYDLDFLRQDNTTGTSAKETVRVHVVSNADFDAAVAQGQQQPPVSTEAVGDPAFAAKLEGLGQYDAALAELLKGYRDGNPSLNDSIGRLYMRTGAYDAAGKYFTKNLGEQGQYGDSAVLGLTRIAILQKDRPEILSLLNRLLAIKDAALEETLLAVARFEKEQKEAGLGIELATEYMSRYPDGKSRDEAEFILAHLLELDSQFRDIARAREIYKEILIRFPESSFAAEAKERIGYIDRHFVEIR